MIRPIVYLAGPIVNLTQQEAQGWREEFNEAVRPYNIHCLSPVRGKNLHIREGSFAGIYEQGCLLAVDTSPDLFNSSVITGRDLFDLKRSQAMVLHISDPAHRSIGSVLEIGFAYAHQIPVIIWADPSDVTRHPMVSHIKYRQTYSLSDTVAALVDLLGMGGLH